MKHEHQSLHAQPSAPRSARIGASLARAYLMLIGLCVATSLYAQGVFHRWEDDQGNVIYSDVIPPTDVDKGRTLMSPHGVAVDRVPPQKTPEEIQRERELERLRAQQQRMLEQQRADDRVLLNTFQSVDDLIMTRDGKLSDIDTMIQFKKGNIRRQQDWLTDLRAEAGDLERKGEAVPEQLQTRIENTERAIQDALAAIVEREQQKQDIRKEFDRDLKRLRQLKQLPETDTAGLADTTQALALDNLVECNDRSNCNQLWQQALNYVKQYATLPIESLGKDVAITKAPTDKADIALIVSRIWHADGQGAKIFLDLQCRSYAPGEDRACKTEARTRVLRGFRTALQGRGQGAIGAAARHAAPVPRSADLSGS